MTSKEQPIQVPVSNIVDATVLRLRELEAALEGQRSRVAGRRKRRGWNPLRRLVRRDRLAPEAGPSSPTEVQMKEPTEFPRLIPSLNRLVSRLQRQVGRLASPPTKRATQKIRLVRSEQPKRTKPLS